MSSGLPNWMRVARRGLRLIFSWIAGNQRCRACGFRGRFVTRNVLWPGLIAEWELSDNWAHWIDLREGQSCPVCGSSLRSGQLAEAIINVVKARTGATGESLNAIFSNQKVRALDIAEINSAGTLHQFLAKSPKLRYSEFGSKMAGVPSENLMNLTYPDAAFDLVVTSETLEHVPGVDRAVDEIYRVLKPGGAHVFTVPIIWDRPKTRQRACLRDGKPVHTFPPSYHGGAHEEKSDYLVFYEFGADFVDRCRRPNIQMEVIRDEKNPALIALIARKII